MSFRAMLKHRCQVLRLAETSEDGMPVLAYQAVQGFGGAIEYRCFLDLTFMRQGKDQQWTKEAARPADRRGVLFADGAIPLRSGDRVLMTRGPLGTFETEGAFDEAWTPKRRHH